MTHSSRIDFRDPIKQGIIAGIITLSVSIIGMVQLFGERDLIANLFTMGQLLIFAAPAAFAYLAARSTPQGQGRVALLCGLIIGFFTALPLIILIWLAEAFNLRQFLINVSPTLIELLTFGRGPVVGSLLLLVAMLLVGLIAAAVYLLPDRYTRPLLNALAITLTIAMFSEILAERIMFFFGRGFAGLIFSAKALQVIPAAILFILFSGLAFWRQSREQESKKRTANISFQENGKPNWRNITIAVIFLLALPLILGTYLSEVINNVGLFVLMGLGLNIVVGFAGLLDLGYVAFYAFGAYTMAILTSEGALGIAGLSFWVALPICVAISALAGILLGMPVLRMRGDYLAIVTLGFGEIIRILALSDLLKPVIGGAQGVLQIPKPSILGISLIKPGQLYYVILAAVLLVAFIAWRLRDSRLGRRWMAIREDEDVAEAMGINLVGTKILAFAIGAAFAGLGGAILAPKLTSIFPHSFKLLVSINVLSLIIVGGMGSLPGVVVGALILVGLPELLREFAEFRILMYGALLIVMMLARPEGFWPSAVRQRELHARDEDFLHEEADRLQAAPGS